MSYRYKGVGAQPPCKRHLGHTVMKLRQEKADGPDKRCKLKKSPFIQHLLACKSMQNSIRQRKSLLEAWERRGNEKRCFGKVNKTKYSFLAELISCLSFNLTASEHLGRSHVSS